jgi:hypothetical protein
VATPRKLQRAILTKTPISSGSVRAIATERAKNPTTAKRVKEMPALSSGGCLSMRIAVSLLLGENIRNLPAKYRDQMVLRIGASW